MWLIANIFAAYIVSITDQNVGSLFLSTLVIGNLERDEAKIYFDKYARAEHNAPECSDEMWEVVYDVCGGNPGALNIIAKLSNECYSSPWEIGV